ncbi:MAG: class I SAM-dependent methyltransferase [Chitinophagales bacterium]|nr:class I SAM-dependent methyltransferase [Chitinophagales bacterium]
MIVYKHLLQTHNKTAASVILPTVLEMTHPESVIDVGCGTGSFLAVLLELGITDVSGIEGDWLDRTKLFVDSSLIKTADLKKEITVERRYDLVISLEVAEHLPGEAADTFVNTLTMLGDIILFSAAVPGQGGQNHLNEQWPVYWMEKFIKKGYSFYDEVRWKFWDNNKVEYWYSQNMFLVIKDGTNDFGLKKTEQPLNVIHPDLFSLAWKSEKHIASEYRKIVWGEMAPVYYARLLTKSILRRLKLLR